MKQRTLGRTGLFVSELCLGTMTPPASDYLSCVFRELSMS